MQLLEKSNSKKPTKKYRDKIALYYQLLKVLDEEGSITVTRLRYRSYGVGNAFGLAMHDLKEADIIKFYDASLTVRKFRDGRSKATQFVVITEKGRKLLEILEKFMQFLPNDFLRFRYYYPNNTENPYVRTEKNFKVSSIW